MCAHSKLKIEIYNKQLQTNRTLGKYFCMGCQGWVEIQTRVCPACKKLVPVGETHPCVAPSSTTGGLI